MKCLAQIVEISGLGQTGSIHHAYPTDHHEGRCTNHTDRCRPDRLRISYKRGHTHGNRTTPCNSLLQYFTLRKQVQSIQILQISPVEACTHDADP